MKVCITAAGSEISSDSDPRFGRCRYFIFADSESGELEAFENEAASGGGAGVKAAGFVAQKKPDCVVTGNIGPNAFSALKAAGIDVYTGCSGKVAGVLKALKAGEYSKADAATGGSHQGMRS